MYVLRRQCGVCVCMFVGECVRAVKLYYINLKYGINIANEWRRGQATLVERDRFEDAALAARL